MYDCATAEWNKTHLTNRTGSRLTGSSARRGPRPCRTRTCRRSFGKPSSSRRSAVGGSVHQHDDSTRGVGSTGSCPDRVFLRELKNYYDGCLFPFQSVSKCDNRCVVVFQKIIWVGPRPFKLHPRVRLCGDPLCIKCKQELVLIGPL